MTPSFYDREAVFFDFDGVIVDSFHVKTRAFAALYADDYPEIVEDVIAYHNANGGVSRHRKFEYFEGVLLGRAPTPQRLDDLAGRFAEAVVEAVIASPEIEGAERLLADLQAQGTPCYVASGTPEEELKMIVARRRLAPYFRAVRGAPAEKAEILAEFIAAHGHDPARCLMVGDALTDYRAAALVGVPFLGVASCAEAAPFPPGVSIVSRFGAPREALA
ncbi:MAG: HAD-IA family hydrolase [Terricaulis sp.]|nr:HAD-IA family hydrolase [Terricaulis sp.]